MVVYSVKGELKDKIELGALRVMKIDPTQGSKNKSFALRLEDSEQNRLLLYVNNPVLSDPEFDFFTATLKELKVRHYTYHYHVKRFSIASAVFLNANQNKECTVRGEGPAYV
jgi:hypothetical protein